MELFICFMVNPRNIVPFALFISPGIPPLGFVTSAQTLICSTLCPPSSAIWHFKFSILCSCSPTLSAIPEASRCPSLMLAFFPTFQLQLQPLVGHQCPTKVPSKHAIPLHSHAFPFFATVHHTQFLK